MPPAETIGPVRDVSSSLVDVNTGHPGSITTIHADSAVLAFEQLTLLVKESEGGRDLLLALCAAWDGLREVIA